MKEYPKVPRYDHPVVIGEPDDDELDSEGEMPEEVERRLIEESDFYNYDDLVVIEKFDGGNARIILYEERFHDEYSEELLELDPEDGDLVFGSKSVLRGTHTMEKHSIEGVNTKPNVDGAFDNFFEYLTDEIDIDAIRGLHDEHGPLVFFVENMVPHTLDYNYTDDPPPTMIGFDIFVVREGASEKPANPYEEDFEGFLNVYRAWDYFRSVGIKPARIIDGPGNLGFNPIDYTVPQSGVAPIQAEGVVIRSDKHNQRVKLRTEEFKEKQKETFGLRPDEADSGEEYIVANYCTATRIRKIINKMVVDEGREFGLHLNDDLYPRVVDDIWDEHYHEIKNMNMEFNPSEIKPLVAKRCINELRKIKKTAELNDRHPTEVWANF